MKRKLQFLVFFLSFALYSQETPPILKFSPKIYQAENQNWAVTQDVDKFIYVANNEGLLQYNGVDWVLYPSPNNTIMRSVVAVEKRIYSGAYMEFGYWDANETGALVYTSLSEKIKDELIEDENFWNIKTLDAWVIFQSYDRLYMYNAETEELSYLTDKANYYRIFKLNKEIFIHKMDGRLFKIVAGKEELVVEFPKEFGIKMVLNIFQGEDELILLTRTKGLFKLSHGVLKKWNVLTPKFTDQMQIFCGIQLVDQSYMLGTISNGLVHIDKDGTYLNSVNQTNGLSNNTVLNLFEDLDGNVWSALDNGLDCLNMRSFIKEFNDNEGVVGTTYCSIIFENNIYIGTNQGLFVKSKEFNDPLRLISGTKGQVWSLFVYRGTLFCGHTSGTYVIADESARQISTAGGTWNFRPIPSHPDWLLQGNYTGLSLLKYDGLAWRFSHKITGFDNSARFVELIGKELWVNHEYKGIYHMLVDDTFTRFDSVVLLKNISKGKGSGLLKYGTSLLYSYEKGVFRLNEDQVFEQDTLLSTLIRPGEYVSGKLIDDQNNRLWSFNKNSISYAEQGPVAGKMNIKFIPIQDYWRKTTVSFENITHLEKDLYIVGKTNGYILIDLKKFMDQTPEIFLNQIEVKGESKTNTLGLQQEEDLDYRYGTLAFKVSTPSYNKYEFVNYQFKMEGLQEQWGAWQEEATVTFENLPPGTYTFMARSKVGKEISSNTISYTFTVLKPLYLTNTALALYAIGVGLLAFFTHRSYKRYYHKQHGQLILENQRQMDLQRIKAEQEVIRLRNDKLNQEIESKNRELAISTMNISKRNQFLRKIQKELKKNTRLEENDPVFKLIEKNLNSTKDWHLFKEAFNNADRDFLKRAKTAHPNLSPNDLKFCAYLRLNLTSKEIAPLLNITVKSVEVRRYRLRKKMNLPHDKNLIDYMLSI